MVKLKLFLLLLLLSSCDGCKRADSYYSVFYFKNNTGSDCSYYFCFFGWDIKPGGIYPDTTLKLINLSDLEVIQGKFGGTHYRRHESLEELFLMLPSDTVSIFWFNNDTLKNYPWSQIQKDYKISARYDLSIHDLNNLEAIPYPPDETMKDKKIYPPYGVK